MAAVSVGAGVLWSGVGTLVVARAGEEFQTWGTCGRPWMWYRSGIPSTDDHESPPIQSQLPLPLRMSIGLAFLTVDAYYRRFIGPHDIPMYLFMFISAPCVTVHSSIKTCNWHHANDIYDSFYDSFMTDRSHCNI